MSREPELLNSELAYRILHLTYSEPMSTLGIKTKVEAADNSVARILPKMEDIGLLERINSDDFPVESDGREVYRSADISGIYDYWLQTLIERSRRQLAEYDLVPSNAEDYISKSIDSLRHTQEWILDDSNSVPVESENRVALELYDIEPGSERHRLKLHGQAQIEIELLTGVEWLLNPGKELQRFFEAYSMSYLKINRYSNLHRFLIDDMYCGLNNSTLRRNSLKQLYSFLNSVAEFPDSFVPVSTSLEKIRNEEAGTEIDRAN